MFTERAFKGMSGVHAPLYTPIGENRQVDESRIGPTVEWCLKNGMKGFYVGGGTGEGVLMSVPERKKMLHRVAAENRERGKLIAHVGANSVDEAVELARFAADLGYDWLSAIQPAKLAGNHEAVRSYYTRIAGSTDLPFMVYSWKADIVPDRDARLFDVPNIRGMKYTAYSYWDIFRLKKLLNRETIFFAGCDEQLLCALSFGAVFSGGIGTTYNTLPVAAGELYRLASEGRFDEAWKFQKQIIDLIDTCFRFKPGLGTFKATMRYIGLDQGRCVEPNATLTEAEYAAFAAELDKLGFLNRG